ncbi:MAG: nucleoside monophosphate kinase, partial [Clostridia bacterium]|nr:nucleoside monophosphate kinase [Clostridia bacterium]
FPRTVAQAESLKQFQNIDYVFYLDVEYSIIEERILGRRVCPQCKAVYNVTNYKFNNCEKCGTEIVTRADDNKETVKKRFDVYTEQTQPLVDFYKNENLLYDIDANLGSDFVTEEIESIVQKEGKQ